MRVLRGTYVVRGKPGAPLGATGNLRPLGDQAIQVCISHLLEKREILPPDRADGSHRAAPGYEKYESPGGKVRTQYAPLSLPSVVRCVHTAQSRPRPRGGGYTVLLYYPLDNFIQCESRSMPDIYALYSRDRLELLTRSLVLDVGLPVGLGAA